MVLPRDWENLITCIQCKPPITVTHGAERVPEFQILVKTFNIHRMTNRWEPVSWQKIKWKRYSPDHPAQILYKYTYQNDHSKILDLSKKQSLRSGIGLFAHTICRKMTTTFCTRIGRSPSFTALQSPSQLLILYSIPLHTRSMLRGRKHS